MNFMRERGSGIAQSDNMTVAVSSNKQYAVLPADEVASVVDTKVNRKECPADSPFHVQFLSLEEEVEEFEKDEFSLSRIPINIQLVLQN